MFRLISITWATEPTYIISRDDKIKLPFLPDFSMHLILAEISGVTSLLYESIDEGGICFHE